MEIKSLDELLKAIRHGETTIVEAKRAEKISDSVLETISAFSNEPGLGGGYLLLDVENKGTSELPDYCVSGVTNAEKLESELATRCRNEMSFPVRPQIRREQHGQAVVVVAYIPEADANDKPIYICRKGVEYGTYRRIGPTDQRCTQDDLAVLFQGRDDSAFDRRPIVGTSIVDVDPDALNEYRRLKKDTLYAGQLLALSDEELLKCLNATTIHQGHLVLTLAGLVLFGRFSALREHLPMMRLDYIRVEGREWMADPSIRHESVEKFGPLFLIIPELIARIVEEMPRKFTLREDQIHREDAPLIPVYAIREVIVNAAMHRNYRKHGPVQVIRFANRLEAINPGCSIIREEQWGQQGSSLTRNPTIAAVLHDVGLAENKGTGIAAMRKAMQRSNLSPPLFESDRHRDTFTARFFLHQLLDEQEWKWLSAFVTCRLSDDEAAALCVARQLGVVNNWLYRELTGADTLTASAHLSRLREAGLLEKQGKGYNTVYKLSKMAANAGRTIFPDAAALTEKRTTGGQAELEDMQSTDLNPPDTAQSRRFNPLDTGQSRGDNPLGSVKSRDFIALDHARLEIQEQIPEPLASSIAILGKRASPQTVQNALLKLCGWKPLGAQQLAYLLRRNVAYLQNEYIRPLVASGRLEYLYPDNPAHPRQAYRAANTPKSDDLIS